MCDLTLLSGAPDFHSSAQELGIEYHLLESEIFFVVWSLATVESFVCIREAKSCVSAVLDSYSLPWERDLSRGSNRHMDKGTESNGKLGTCLTKTIIWTDTPQRIKVFWMPSS